MLKSNDKLTYLEIVAFFVPIAISTMIMMTTHSVVNSALARSADAALAIASYAVAKSVATMLYSPCTTLRRICVAHFNDQKKFSLVTKVAFMTSLISLVLMALIAFTPLGNLVFKDLMGVSDNMLPETLRAFTILLVIPIIASIRSVYEGMITVSKKTYQLTIVTTTRVVVMFLLATFITNTQIITGSIIGSTLMVFGIGSEAVVTFIFARKYKDDLPKVNKDFKEESFKSLWIFFIPLIAAEFAMTWGQPSVNAGLARVADPEVSLAAYQVARSLSWIFISMFARSNQIVLVFVRDKFTWTKVKRFNMVLGFAMGVILLTLALTPLGEWVLLNIISVDSHLTAMALRAILVFSLVPIMVSINETFSGLLIRNNSTPIITFAKLGNVVGVIVGVWGLSMLFPFLGAAIGALATLAGYAVEFIILFSFSRKHERRVEYISSY